MSTETGNSKDTQEFEKCQKRNLKSLKKGLWKSIKFVECDVEYDGKEKRCTGKS